MARRPPVIPTVHAERLLGRRLTNGGRLAYRPVRQFGDPYLGCRNCATTDDSRNNPLIGFITAGEGWHNNHFADAT